MTVLPKIKKKQNQPPAVKLSLFVKGLLRWNEKENTRIMPWKGEKDPYKIWLSEIILQQTRVEQGLKYYEKFINAYPDIKSLAAASTEKIFKLWEGLGYYSRCRNLITSARFLAVERDGVFPKEYASILQLKGVGTYTAAAIASFAYNLPHAVLDGNVFRVLSRIGGIEIPIDSGEGKKHFSRIAQSMLPSGLSATYNQAIMDFGAVVCKPLPLCAQCFFQKHCLAFLNGKQDVLPVKENKIKIRKRWFTYFVTTCDGAILIHQRTEKDIWQQLYEFPLIESTNELSGKDQMQLFKKQYGFKNIRLISSAQQLQKLTHQIILFNIIEIEVERKKKVGDFEWIAISDLDQYALPKTLHQYSMKKFPKPV